MAHDGSLNSNLEAWALALINTNNPDEGNPRFNQTALWEGSFFSDSGDLRATQIVALGSPACYVTAWDFAATKVDENPGDHSRDLIVVVGTRGADHRTRVGTSTEWGLHRSIEQIIEWLDDTTPNVLNGASNKTTGQVQFQSVRGLWEAKDVYVAKVNFRVQVVPIAT